MTKTMADNITPEECEKLWDWLVEVLGRDQLPVFNGVPTGSVWQRWAQDYILNDDAVTEKLRRALAVKEILVSQMANTSGWLIVLHKLFDETMVKWNRDKDPTGKHALMRAILNLIGG